jgi:hypothetical protein
MSSATIPAVFLPSSTAKFVPLSYGYTWLIEAKYSPFTCVRIGGTLREWLNGGTSQP